MCVCVCICVCTILNKSIFKQPFYNLAANRFMKNDTVINAFLENIAYSYKDNILKKIPKFWVFIIIGFANFNILILKLSTELILS